MILKQSVPFWNYLTCGSILALLCPFCCALLRPIHQADVTIAHVNLIVLNSEGLLPTFLRLDGRYGADSPQKAVKGLLLRPVPNSRDRLGLGCDPHTEFPVPANTIQWIALLRRGHCTFREKIKRAASQNASAVIIYNNISSAEPVSMAHSGTGDTVAVMITESKAKMILNYLDNNMTVLTTITVGLHMQSATCDYGYIIYIATPLALLIVLFSVWLICFFTRRNQKKCSSEISGQDQGTLERFNPLC